VFLLVFVRSSGIPGNAFFQAQFEKMLIAATEMIAPLLRSSILPVVIGSPCWCLRRSISPCMASILLCISLSSVLSITGTTGAGGAGRGGPGACSWGRSS
jgi:hypothetical protein